MSYKLQLELYTRPTCSDCQEAKKYLTSNGIYFIDKDVSKIPDLEEELKKISGTSIVLTPDLSHHRTSDCLTIDSEYGF